MRELDDNEDIIHFRKIRAQLPQEEIDELEKKLKAVSKGNISRDEKEKLMQLYQEDKSATKNLKNAQAESQKYHSRD